MKRFEAQEIWLPPVLLPRYAAAVQRFKSREERFSSRALLSFVAASSEGFEVRAGAAGEPTEILLYDEIGFWGVTAKEFVLALAAAGPGPIRLRINSPGGDTFDGLAIYNALRARTAPVTVVVDGIAASAASFIAMAGQRLEMPEQSMLMIHNCWGLCIGNRNDMLDMAAVQEKTDGQMAQIYAKKCGKTAVAMAAAMDAETYYTSTEAKALGLCDAIIDVATAPPVMAAKTGSGLRAADRPRGRVAAELPPYDPDGDGDNDAAEALTLIGAAMTLLEDAAEALSGAEEEDVASGAGDGSAIVLRADGSDDTAAADDLLPPEEQLQALLDALDRFEQLPDDHHLKGAAASNPNHDPKTGEFSEGGGSGGGDKAPTLKARVSATTAWLKSASAQEIVQKVAESHAAKEALTFAVGSLIAHGFGSAHTGGGFWYAEPSLEHDIATTVHNLAAHLSVTTGRATEMLRSAISGLKGLRSAGAGGSAQAVRPLRSGAAGHVPIVPGARSAAELEAATLTAQAKRARLNRLRLAEAEAA